MADFIQDAEELDRLLPKLSMNPIARHKRDDHRECPPEACDLAGYDLRLTPIYMDLWLDSDASKIF